MRNVLIRVLELVEMRQDVTLLIILQYAVVHQVIMEILSFVVSKEIVRESFSILSVNI